MSGRGNKQHRGHPLAGRGGCLEGEEGEAVAAAGWGGMVDLAAAAVMVVEEAGVEMMVEVERAEEGTEEVQSPCR